ncbi:flagellar protein [Vibrio albus]|uniref:Flagellar protein FliL n=1 Tax=Vibrio albus TaxID=2200953 RepID=A0A2U3B8G5_9VIBR|nr:flagellar basal body-associated FliL family protein [Vibrio albus]PWI33014.1 flagellar protein [Vibrio albus]
MTKRNTIMIFVAMLLTCLTVSAATVAGTVWYMQNQNKLDFKSVLSRLSLSDNKPEDKPTFHSLEKLVLGVKGKQQTHFIMLEIAVKTHKPEQIKAIDGYMPLVRNALLRLFSNKAYEDLQAQREIDTLQNEVKATLLTAFADTHFVQDIDDVILTKYVIQ